MAKLRINRALALAGAASRRGAEQLIRAGRVTLNGQAVTDLATQVDPARDRLAVDGKPLSLAAAVYYLYHKPRGMVATVHDELGRSCVGDICATLPGGPRPVGRLDRSSEGLMLLTNDGELANRLAHPRYAVRKRYQLTLQPRLTQAAARRALAGVELDDGPARLLQLELLEEDGPRSRLEVVVSEGRNRLLRRLFEALGFEVLRLKRLELGVLRLGKLALGKTRALSNAEITHLRQSVGLD